MQTGKAFLLRFNEQVHYFPKRLDKSQSVWNTEKIMEVLHYGKRQPHEYTKNIMFTGNP